MPLPWPDNASKEMGGWKELHECSAFLPHWADLSRVGPDLEVCRRAGIWQTGCNQTTCITPKFCQINSLLPQDPPEPLGEQLSSWNQCVPSLWGCFPPSLQPLSAKALAQGKLCPRMAPGNGQCNEKGHKALPCPNRANELLFMHLLLWSPKAH